jgi:drug/metabolite transporter (DMT)-like permease
VVAPRPLLGYAMVLAAATLWGLNGSAAKAVLTTGLSSMRLAEVRSTGGVLGLTLVLALVRPQALRVTRRELPFLIAFGVLGLAFVQWFYFLAIHRLEIGVALLIQYVAPVLVALYARFVGGEHVRRRIWAALILSLGGLSFVVDVWGGLSLDVWGVAAALGSAITFSLYILLAEDAVGGRDPVSLVCYGLGFAAVFWALIQPWWSFPFGVLDEVVTMDGALIGTEAPVWALMVVVVVIGTIVPFGLVVGALRHLPATRVGVTAMWEPVAGGLIAYAWLGEALSAAQLGGGALVLLGIVLAQTAR